MSDEQIEKLKEISDHLHTVLTTKFLGHYTVNDETLSNIKKYVMEAYEFEPSEYDIKVKQNDKDPYIIDVIVTQLDPAKFIKIDIKI